MTAKKTATKTAEGLSAEAIPSSIYGDDMFADDAIIEHEVQLADGKPHTMYFKGLTALEWKLHLEAESSKDNKVRRASTARLIAKSLVEPNGKRALTPQRAAQLKPAVSGAIFLAIMQINGFFRPGAAPVVEQDDSDDISGLDTEDAEGVEALDSEETGSGN